MLKYYPRHRSLASFGGQRDWSENWSCQDKPETETLVLLHVWFCNFNNVGFNAFWDVRSNLRTDCFLAINWCTFAIAMKKSIPQKFRSGRTCLINVGLTHASATLHTAVARSAFFSVTDLAVSTITFKDPTGCFAHTSKNQLFTNAMKKTLHLSSL